MNGNQALVSEHQSVNPWREAISILSEKYRRFSFVHPVTQYNFGGRGLMLKMRCKGGFPVITETTRSELPSMRQLAEQFPVIAWI